MLTMTWNDIEIIAKWSLKNEDLRSFNKIIEEQNLLENYDSWKLVTKTTNAVERKLMTKRAN